MWLPQCNAFFFFFFKILHRISLLKWKELLHSKLCAEVIWALCLNNLLPHKDSCHHRSERPSRSLRLTQSRLLDPEQGLYKTLLCILMAVLFSNIHPRPGLSRKHETKQYCYFNSQEFMGNNSKTQTPGGSGRPLETPRNTDRATNKLACVVRGSQHFSLSAARSVGAKTTLAFHKLAVSHTHDSEGSNIFIFISGMTQSCRPAFAYVFVIFGPICVLN